MSADVPTVILTGPAMVPLVRAAAALEVLRARDDTTYDAADPHTITSSGAEVQFQDVEAVDDAADGGAIIGD